MNTNTSSLTNKILLSNLISYDNTRKYTTFYQVLGSQEPTEQGLGIASSAGFQQSGTAGGIYGSAFSGYSTTIPSSKREDADAIYNTLREKIAVSSLNGYIPADGEKYGINGTPESWANFLTNLAYIESGFKTTAVGDVGRFVGGSNGLFQLSPNDALNYKIQSTPFTIAQLQDPNFNMDVTVKIVTDLTKKSGVIGLGGQGMARYWGPIQRGWTPSRDAIYGGFSPAASKIASDKIANSAQVAWEYLKMKASPDPFTGHLSFYDQYVNNFAQTLDNYQREEYGIGLFNSTPKYFQDSLTEMLFPTDKYQSSFDTFIGPVSETVGFFATNTYGKYTDSVAPYFDIPSISFATDAFSIDPKKYTIGFGGPDYLNPSDLTKTPQYVFDSIGTSSEILKGTENVNLKNFLKPDDNANVYAGAAQDQATSLVGTSDIPSFISFNENKEVYLNEFKSLFPTTFDYISYFGTINDTVGYNPRDYRGKNLEKMNDFYFDINVEGKIISVDLLQKKYKHSISRRSIKKSLCLNTGCGDKDNKKQEQATTASINKEFLAQNSNPTSTSTADTAVTTPTTLAVSRASALRSANNTASNKSSGPIFNSFSDKAVSTLEQANQFMSIPQQQVAELSYQVSKIGIGNLPVAGPLLMSPIQDLFGSVSQLAAFPQQALTKFPSVLPSINPGSFPQIAGLMLNTNWENLDVNSAIGVAQQINKIVCDFKLPIIGKIDFNNITDIKMDDFGDEFEKIFQGFQKKFEKAFKDLQKKIKNIIPNFIKNIKALFKSIFECQDKPNIKNSTKKTSS